MASDHPDRPRQSALRRTLRFARGWYGSGEKRTAWGLTALVLLMTLAQIGIALRVNLWNGDLFSALERRDQGAMLLQAWIFPILALLTMALAVAQLWARQMLALSWRRWLVRDLQGRWARQGRNYHMGLLPDAADNPDQRISENTRWATAVAVDLGASLLYAVINLISFVGLLWTLSAAVPVAGLALPGGMLGIAVLYAAGGTLFTWWLGRPLIGIHIDRQRAESDHRFALIRLRENAEAVAMIEGGADEARVLDGAFGQVVGAMHRMLRQERHLMWLGSGYGMVAAALPLLLAGPAFFAGALGLGTLVQLGQAFAEVVRALSWLQEHWPQLADWRSHVERIAALEDSLAAAEALGREGGIAVEAGAPALVLDRVTLRNPAGRVLLDGASAVIRAGERVLIQGGSGCGKSTLFRAAAGLWPWGEGRIRMPAREDTMLLPQRPYLPLGTLRDAVCYPAAPGRFGDAAIAAALARCGLPALAARLDEAARWDRMLSLGEQQRLGFARLLLHSPRWVLLDESTSALDDAAEASVMRLFEQELAGAALVSIGHRPGLARFHDRVLRLEGGRLVATAQGVLQGTAMPPLPAPGRVRVAHAHAVPEQRLVARAERARSLGQPAR
ncbi:ABC transporter ATP-binding protein/permease [Paracraurococcus lichenis]|uniref:ABC transporter ATP-binding protein/permease n=1 Tax=Paracraurococcus lichenis TaxID=3064888 RepID=A0ABT9DS49_9PROT|nr:ABC transporter ATP-binding protein/permease [Paracraurococcus sp. LOR1-02]MDO9706718.1 ABC transporter ATP-binding protein/permease [Paracraurococcus sp. LOR1-02]